MKAIYFQNLLCMFIINNKNCEIINIREILRETMYYFDLIFIIHFQNTV